MLVLSRKVGEKIILTVEGETVEITVTEIDRGKVRIGTIAPKRMPIVRSELLERDKEKKDAS